MSIAMCANKKRDTLLAHVERRKSDHFNYKLFELNHFEAPYVGFGPAARRKSNRKIFMESEHIWKARDKLDNTPNCWVMGFSSPHIIWRYICNTFGHPYCILSAQVLDLMNQVSVLFDMVLSLVFIKEINLFCIAFPCIHSRSKTRPKPYMQDRRFYEWCGKLDWNYTNRLK